MRFHALSLILFFVVLNWSETPKGNAQDAISFASDNLSQAVRNQHLDSYWLDQKRWMSYGYRPQVKAKTTPYANIPSYFSHHNSYSYGTNLPVPTTDNPYDKRRVQLTKYGTWH